MVDDPLTALIVDEATQFDRARAILASILKPYVEITAESGSLVLLSSLYELPVREQILVLLCGRLAQKLLGKLSEKEDEKLSQAEIMRFLPAVATGTIKSQLNFLRSENYVINDDRKNYVSLGLLAKIEKRLQELGKKL